MGGIVLSRFCSLIARGRAPLEHQGPTFHSLVVSQSRKKILALNMVGFSWLFGLRGNSSVDVAFLSWNISLVG